MNRHRTPSLLPGAGLVAVLYLLNVLPEPPVFESSFVRVVGGVVAFVIALAAVGQAIEWLLGKTNFVRAGAMLAASRYPRASFAVVVGLGLLVGGVAFAAGWRWLTKPPEQKPQATSVFVDYQLSRSLPESLRAGEQVRILQVRETGGPGNRLYVQSGPTRFTRGDGRPTRNPPFVTVTNKGKETLHDLELEFIASFFDGYPSGEAQPLAVRTYVVKVPVLTASESYEFLVSNWSIEYTTTVSLPKSVRAVVEGESGPRLMPVRMSQITDYDGITRLYLSKRDVDDALP